MVPGRKQLRTEQSSEDDSREDRRIGSMKWKWLGARCGIIRPSIPWPSHLICYRRRRLILHLLRLRSSKSSSPKNELSRWVACASSACSSSLRLLRAASKVRLRSPLDAFFHTVDSNCISKPDMPDKRPARTRASVLYVGASASICISSFLAFMPDISLFTLVRCE